MDAAPGASPPLVAIVGPTAVGKTALAVALARRLPDATGVEGVEIVSADSRQVYRLMDIATAKPSVAERQQAPHHLLDVAWPDEPYTLADYQRDAQGAIADIHARARLPLLVGGTGLYIRAVVDGLAIPQVAPHPALREELEADAAARGSQALVERLRALDPVSAARIDSANQRRLIRAIEVSVVTGLPFSAQQGARPTPYRTAVILGLDMERTALYERADLRIEEMWRQGLIEETRALLARGYDPALPSMSSLGYREAQAYLRGDLTLGAAQERFAFATHAYIRRQLTWFRADTRAMWLDARQPLDALVERASKLIEVALSGN